MARRAARAAGRNDGRVHDQRHDGQLHGPRRRAPCGPATRRLGRRRGRSRGRPADPRHRRRGRPCLAVARPPLRRARPWPGRTHPDRRRGPDGPRGAGRRAARSFGADHRLRAARRGEHRRARSDRPDRRDRPRPPERVAPCRRRIRPVGRGKPAPAPPRRRASRTPTPGRPTPTSGSTCPYDGGIVFVRDGAAHRAAMGAAAAYLPPAPGQERDPMDWVPEMSRRGRGFAIYAAIRELGADGIAALVERCCDLARRMARRLANAPRRPHRQRGRPQPGPRGGR